MKPVINPLWFWLMDVSDNLDLVLLVFGVIVAAICVVIFMNEVAESTTKAAKKWFVVSLIALALTGIIPSSNTITKMLIASTVTYDNIDAVKGEVTDLVDYIVEKVDGEKEDKE